MKPKNTFRPLLAAVVGLALATASHGAPVIYEGFDYDTPGLNGKSSASNVGLDGTWTAGGDTLVVAGSLDYGSLDTIGNSISGKANLNRFGGTRAISATALSGLLDDGGVLWFSVMLGVAPGTNGTNHDLALALATDGFVTANGSTTSLTAGQGIGVYLKNGLARAAVYSTSTVATVASTGTAYNMTTGGSGLVVGRITWGATPAALDTIDIFQPGTDLSLGSVVSTTTGTIDQSALDTLTFRWRDPVLMDEIRFGATAADVMPELVQDSALQLVDFTYNALDGTSEVSIKGAANTAYKLTEADDLDFSTPDQDPVPLTGATVGTLDGNQVTTDANGDATVQFNLGTAKAATFIRAVSVE